MKYLLSVIFSIFAINAMATNNGGVFSPVVNEDHKLMQYRIAVDPDNNGQSLWAQRLHYEQSINGDFMWRIVGQTRKTAESETDFDFIQGELFWQTIDEADYDSGVRFDLRYRDNNRANQFGVNWMHQYSFANDWEARLVLLTAVQFGDNKSSGISLGTRANISTLTSAGRAGLEMFSSYGRTNDVNSLSEQDHAIGPFITNRIGNDGWAYAASALFGVTNEAADLNLRLWIAKSF